MRRRTRNGDVMVHASTRSPRVRSLSWFAAVVTLVSVCVGGFLGHANAATPGAELWAKRYNGTANGDESVWFYALGVSPDGSSVFVTGSSTGSTSGLDYATVSYDASTGAKLWAKRYNGEGNGTDFATALG